MPKALIFIFTLVSIQYFNGQKPWELECDTLKTQAEMNICSHNSYLFADDFLKSQYRKLINRSYSENKSCSLSFINNQIRLIRNSELAFRKMRLLTAKSVSASCNGGTITAYIYNCCLLEITVNQIKVLEKFDNVIKG